MTFRLVLRPAGGSVSTGSSSTSGSSWAMFSSEKSSRLVDVTSALEAFLPPQVSAGALEVSAGASERTGGCTTALIFGAFTTGMLETPPGGHVTVSVTVSVPVRKTERRR